MNKNQKNPQIQRILVTGGGGYVGSVLVPMLLEKGYSVNVLDTFWYGEEVLEKIKTHPELTIFNGDVRNKSDVESAASRCDCVIHLACISNDPSFDMNPALGESINLSCFEPLVLASKAAGVKRFIYASSSSVYGVKEKSDVTENDTLEPLTDYSKFKVDCEKILLKHRQPGFCVTTVRPATVCGYAPRQRLDVVVNILTNLAFNKGEITVFGGEQLRPNIHIVDMCRVYLLLLASKEELIDGEVFNAGYENHPVSELAKMAKNAVGKNVSIKTEPTDDNRSYHVSSKKISDVLGFHPSKTIEDAMDDLVEAFKSKKLRDPLNNSMYYNIKRMNELDVE